MNTSPRKDADVRRPSVSPKQRHAGKLASASFPGLRERKESMDPTPSGSIGESDNVFSKSVTDRYVASGTTTHSDWFHIAGLAAVAEGHISPEGLERVMAALAVQQ